MKFEVDNNINEVVRRVLTRMKIEGVNSKNLKKKLRREKKKNTSTRPMRQRAAMYLKMSLDPKKNNIKGMRKKNFNTSNTNTINTTNTQKTPIISEPEQKLVI